MLKAKSLSPYSVNVLWLHPMVEIIEDVLDALNREGVRYLVVGGVAVVLHGHLRSTADLDLVIQLSEENASRAVKALGALGYRPRVPVSIEQFAKEEIRKGWIKDKGLTVFSLWHPQRPLIEVDLFVAEPFDFDEAYQRALEIELNHTSITVVSLKDLLALKRSANRPQDIADIEALENLESSD